MPTELTMTTRMPPVRHPAKPGSGVRPITDPAIPQDPAFDRRPTAPIRREPELAAADSSKERFSTLAYDQDTQPPAAPGERHTPAIPTYGVIPAQQAPSAADYAFYELDEVEEEDDAPFGRDAAALAQPTADAPRHEQAQPARRSYPPPPPPRAASSGGYQPAPMHRAEATGWHTPSFAHEAAQRAPARGGAAAHPASSDGLTQVRLQLAAALESARKQEQRAMDAELRASWAERFMAQLQTPEPDQRAQRREQRMRWLKRVLEISCVGLALGGYISLLVPVRERVIAQDAMIHQLTTLQAQLRDEKRVLLQRIESLQGSNAVTPP